MKIRCGFVSNSSSSSFLIYGVVLENNQSLFKDTESVLDLLEEAAKEVEQVSVEYPPDDDYVYVGMSWSQVKDDETGAQFKARVEKAVTEVIEKVGYTEKVKFSTYKEAWRDC